MKNCLTRTNSISTLVQVTESEDVDATARKLVQRMKELEEQQGRIGLELSSIRIALSVAGIKRANIHGRVVRTKSITLSLRHSKISLSENAAR